MSQSRAAACHSEASLIREESAWLLAAKPQIPRARMPRFGMTNLLGDFQTAAQPEA